MWICLSFSLLKCDPSFVPAKSWGYDDVGFVQQLLINLTQRFCVDLGTLAAWVLENAWWAGSDTDSRRDGHRFCMLEGCIGGTKFLLGWVSRPGLSLNFNSLECLRNVSASRFCNTTRRREPTATTQNLPLLLNNSEASALRIMLLCRLYLCIWLFQRWSLCASACTTVAELQSHRCCMWRKISPGSLGSDDLVYSGPRILEKKHANDGPLALHQSTWCVHPTTIHLAGEIKIGNQSLLCRVLFVGVMWCPHCPCWGYEGNFTSQLRLASGLRFSV